MTNKFGIAGGALTVILANIHSSDLLKTAVLAGIGASVSYLMTWLLNRLTKKNAKK